MSIYQKIPNFYILPLKGFIKFTTPSNRINSNIVQLMNNTIFQLYSETKCRAHISEPVSVVSEKKNISINQSAHQNINFLPCDHILFKTYMSFIKTTRSPQKTNSAAKGLKFWEPLLHRLTNGFELLSRSKILWFLIKTQLQNNSFIGQHF